MIIKIENRALLKVSGIDGKSFLQSQFSNDINNIKENNIQINAYCQHQGKIVALLWVFKRGDNYYLSMPISLKEVVLNKLHMFKLMSRVVIEDHSSLINQYGLINKEKINSFKLINNLSILTTRKNLKDEGSLADWEKACIDSGLPEIYPENSGKFIPQDLNIDLNELGVSFSKGCYPGQEVVARMHYLGKPKRRLFQFESIFDTSIGDSINVRGSKSLKSSGEVISVVMIEKIYYFLGTLEIKHIADEIFLNNDINKPLSIINAK